MPITFGLAARPRCFQIILIVFVVGYKIYSPVAASFIVSHVSWVSTVVLPYPGTRPYMTFLFVSSQIYTPASFRPYLTVAPLPSVSNFVTFSNVTWNTYRGL